MTDRHEKRDFIADKLGEQQTAALEGGEAALRSKLVEARVAARKTQADVAKAMGCPQSRISKLETGSMRRLPFVFAVKLSRLYGVPLTSWAEAVR